jgi:hypothetical protein
MKDPDPIKLTDYIPTAVIVIALAILFFIGGCRGLDYLIKVDVPTGMGHAIGVGARVPLAEADFTLKQFQTWVAEQLRVYDMNVQDAAFYHELIIAAWDVNVGPTLEGAMSGIPFGLAGFSLLSWLAGGILGKKKGTYTTKEEWQKKFNDAMGEQLEKLRVEKEASYNKGYDRGSAGG